MVTTEEFQEIVSQTKPVVLSAVSRHLYERFHHAIDDVAQETYIRAYKALVKDKFQGKSALETWLYAIARNESIRMNGKLHREEERREKLGRERDEPALDSSGTVENESELARLYQGLLRLPAKYASVLKMYWKGKSEREIAESLSLTRGTVKSRAHRGRELLRKMMEEGNT